MNKYGYYALAAIAVLLLGTCAVRRFDASLNRGLEEEKSYSRHAMEYHREHLEKRRGDVRLDLWSTADYLAQSVQKHDANGVWAKWSDEIAYLPSDLKRFNGHPFCVIESAKETVVVAFYVGPNNNVIQRSCDSNSISAQSVAHIRSGDLDSVGAPDNCFIYVLRRD